MNSNYPAKSLIELLKSLPGEKTGDFSSCDVTGIAFDSRCVQPGFLFVALTGENVDGHRFIPDAVRRGACAIIGTEHLEGLAVPYVQVTDSRYALAILSAAFYDFPARNLTVIGITGTDGKTTTANLLFSILKYAGVKTGLISTVNAVIGEQILDTGFHVTTPEAPDVQRYLASMVQAGLDTVILEATSHGLAQHRLAACEFDIGVVTNISHEHLDYHGSFEAYQTAKARLFTSLSRTAEKPKKPPRAAVLNFDDVSFEFLAGSTRVNIVKYGIKPGADVRAVDIHSIPGGQLFTVVGRHPDSRPYSFTIQTGLIGGFNISNCLAAIATSIDVLNLSEEHIQKGVASLSGVPGRMERIDIEEPFKQDVDFIAIVDFAHTPNALRKSLEAARQLTSGRVIAIFGSAGLRDRAKRRMMAQEAVQIADLIILTAEDPRTESLERILSEMAVGARESGGVEGQNFLRIADRREAVRYAINHARRGDLVIACGKGHEQSMCFGVIEYPWDDRVAMRAALAERFSLPGPEMPYLP